MFFNLSLPEIKRKFSSLINHTFLSSFPCENLVLHQYAILVVFATCLCRQHIDILITKEMPISFSGLVKKSYSCGARIFAL